ncbi:hypothetical protein VTK73DRAFT_3460 [Phialemonium thermophilum]|uniref:Uncharacterized protein n=1 Tax=Phialemonium thermophilum TaxID=223376 RepID=A0ABR3VIW2_9PEZI
MPHPPTPPQRTMSVLLTVPPDGRLPRDAPGQPLDGHVQDRLRRRAAGRQRGGGPQHAGVRHGQPVRGGRVHLPGPADGQPVGHDRGGGGAGGAAHPPAAVPAGAAAGGAVRREHLGGQLHVREAVPVPDAGSHVLDRESSWTLFPHPRFLLLLTDELTLPVQCAKAAGTT